MTLLSQCKTHTSYPPPFSLLWPQDELATAGGHKPHTTTARLYPSSIACCILCEAEAAAAAPPAYPRQHQSDKTFTRPEDLDLF